MRARWLAAPLLALAAGACDITGFDDDAEGWYSYGGTVEDSPRFSVAGELRIYGQRGNEAAADLDWYMLENGERIFEVFAEDVLVQVSSDDRVRFTAWGEFQLEDGRWREFELEHEGRLRGNTLRGSWWLDTDIPSSDEGEFIAER
jgi:hypothetical protein